MYFCISFELLLQTREKRMNKITDTHKTIKGFFHLVNVCSQGYQGKYLTSWANINTFIQLTI